MKRCGIASSISVSYTHLDVYKRQALAQTLLQNSPQAMQAVKRLLAVHARRRLDDEIEEAIGVNAQQRSSEDFKEGVEAFLQHRRPDWPSMKGGA